MVVGITHAALRYLQNLIQKLDFDHGMNLQAINADAIGAIDARLRQTYKSILHRFHFRWKS
jgi:hypothetical protein